jgi:preprotein translocase subunit Sec63
VSQQLFLYVNIILMLVFGILFWLGRRSALKNTTQFKMSADNNTKNKSTSLKIIGENLDDLNAENMISLNVIFIYNGHTWDAHEVLGIEPGSSIEEIKAAFQRAISINDVSSHEFLKTALAAIFQNLKNQGFEPQ